MTNTDKSKDALMNAVRQTSMTNYETIFSGFMEKGIAEADIEPRVNVFTSSAWLALGRQIKEGETGVKITTVFERKETGKEGDEITTRQRRTTKVFHISQTEEIKTETEA